MGKKAMVDFYHKTHTGHILSDKEFWFIHYYVQTHDRNKAAKKAGYASGSSVGRLFNKDYIVEELNYLEGNIQDKAGIDTARLYKELWQIGTGIQKDPFGFDIAPADRIKAVTELLKRTDDLKAKEKMLKDSAINIKITRDYIAMPKNTDSKESEENV